MRLNRRSGLLAFVLSLVVVSLLFVFLVRSSDPRVGTRADLPGAKVGLQDLGAAPAKPKTDVEKKPADGGAEKAPEAQEEEVEEEGEPLLSGTVYGETAPLPGATVTAYPFQLVKDLIRKYESLSIGGFADIPGLVRQVKGDLLALRSRGIATKTDEAGRYAYRDLKPGEHAFLVVGPGHVFRVGDTTVINKKEPRILDFHLQVGQVVAGKVVDPSGVAVAGASVLAVYQVKGIGGIGKFVRRLLGLVNGEFLSGPFRDTTDGDGRFRLDTLPPGLYELNVHHAAYSEGHVPDVATGTTEIVVKLGPGGTVRGRLVDASGEPVADIPVALTAKEDKVQIPVPVPGVSEAVNAFRRLIGDDDLEAHSTAEGIFTYERVRPGAYELSIEAVGFLPHRQPLSVVDGEVLDLGDITLDRGSSIRGVVITKKKEPVSGASVTAQVETRGRMQFVKGLVSHLTGRSRTSANEAGEFVLSGIHAAESMYRVVAFQETRGMGMVSGVVPDGEPVEIVLQDPWYIKGIVVRASDKTPVPGAQVTGGGAETTADEAGRFALGPALPGAGRTLFGGGRPQLHLYVGADGLEPHHAMLSEEEISEEITVELRREASVEGIVRGPDGDPQPGSIVRLVPGELPPIGGFELLTLGVTFSDREGTFRFGELRHGMDVRALAVFPGYATAESERLRLRPDEPPPYVELELGLGGSIVGLVTDGRDPLSGVKIRMQQGRPQGRERGAAFFLQMFGLPEAGKVTYSSSEGRFSYRDLAPGLYSVTASAGAGIKQNVEVDVVPEKETEVVMELEVGGTISGVVFTAEGGPIPAATVRLLESGNQSRLGLQKAFGGALVSQVTDQLGQFLFKQVKTGRYVLIAQKEGYAPREIDSVYVDQEAYAIVLELEASIVGEVKLQGTGEPVTVFQTRLDKVMKKGRWTSPLKQWRGVENLDGVFLYERLEAGTYQIEVRAEGAAPKIVDVAVESGKESFVKVELEKPGVITGVVLAAADQRPVSRARVAIVASTGSSTTGSAGEVFGAFMEDRMKEIATMTGDDGRFVMAEVPPGTHTVEATHKDFRPGTTQVTVEAGAEVDCRIDLRFGFDLSGIIVDHAGEPEPERMLLVTGPENTEKVTRSAEDGTWLVSGLKAGTYRIYCPTPDLSRELPPVDIEITDDTAGVEIALPPPLEEPPLEELPPEETPAEGQPRPSIPEDAPIPEDVRDTIEKKVQ